MVADPRERPAADVAPVVEDMLCLALYAASRAMTSRYRALLEPLELTYPQYLVLLVLRADGRSSLGEVGDRLRLESSTLSPLVKRLQAVGLVTRSRSETDERRISIELTAAGEDRCARAARVPEQIGAATGLDEGQQDALLQLLQQLEANLRA